MPPVMPWCPGSGPIPDHTPNVCPVCGRADLHAVTPNDGGPRRWPTHLPGLEASLTALSGHLATVEALAAQIAYEFPGAPLAGIVVALADPLARLVARAQEEAAP